ncbi:uncharacterized protein LOC144094540 isoform X2 [Amblyomma americanum]
MAPRMKGGGWTSLVACLWFHCLLLWGHCWTYHCNEVYRRLSSRHTICLPRREDCSIASAGITKKEIKDILDAHNTYRQMVARGNVPGLDPAANMMKLVWDNELAAVAQAHANQCRFHHDCYSCRRVSRFNAGQNLFLHYSSSLQSKPTDWAGVVKSWFDEYKLFDPSEVDAFRTVEDSGHFTQMIWAKTTYIGCGKARFKIEDEDWYRTLYTCNYGPLGNVVKSRVYEKGPACSHCPNETTCSHSTPGLCTRNARHLGRLAPANAVRVYHFPQRPHPRTSLLGHVRVYHFPQQAQRRTFNALPNTAMAPIPRRVVPLEPEQRIGQGRLPLNSYAAGWRSGTLRPDFYYDPNVNFVGYPLQRLPRKAQEVLSKQARGSSAESREEPPCKCDEASIEQMRKKLLSLIPKEGGIEPEIKIKCHCQNNLAQGTTNQVFK